MFADANEVLVWAGREQYKLCIKGSSINANYRAPRNDTTPRSRADNDVLSGLSQQDRKLQCALIINTVSGIKPQYVAEYIAVKYGYTPPESKYVTSITKNLLLTTLKSSKSPSGYSTGRHKGVSLAILEHFGVRLGSALSKKCIRAENKSLVFSELDRLNIVSNTIVRDIFIEKNLIKG